MCGHAIIALVKFVHETGLIKKEANEPEFLIDAPPGIIRARAILNNNKVERVFFKNVPSFVLYSDRYVEIPEIGSVKVDVAFGGAFYAIANADEIGIGLEVNNVNQLIDVGMKIKKAVVAEYKITHPFEEDLAFLYGTIFAGKPVNPENHSRNVCIFANGEVDRSATGSGVSARAAVHNLKDGLEINQEITIESILGTTMTVKVVEETTFGKFKAVIPEVSGTAFFTGQHKFWFDSEDELKDGFIIR
jgi:trans-L-3-hydroxyproline dehydratase